jgi:hypothetical protein
MRPAGPVFSEHYRISDLEEMAPSTLDGSCVGRLAAQAAHPSKSVRLAPDASRGALEVLLRAVLLPRNRFSRRRSFAVRPSRVPLGELLDCRPRSLTGRWRPEGCHCRADESSLMSPPRYSSSSSSSTCMKVDVGLEGIRQDSVPWPAVARVRRRSAATPSWCCRCQQILLRRNWGGVAEDLWCVRGRPAAGTDMLTVDFQRASLPMGASRSIFR